MKIEIKNARAVLINDLITLLPRLATVFVVVYIGTILIYGVISNYGVPVFPWLPSVLAIFFVLLLTIKRALEAQMQAKGTFLELKDKSISCTISGLSTRSFSIPLNQISSVHIQQNFTDKIFNICRVVIVQIASTAVVYGFNYTDAVKFSEQFAHRRAEKGL